MILEGVSRRSFVAMVPDNLASYEAPTVTCIEMSLERDRNNDNVTFRRPYLQFPRLVAVKNMRSRDVASSADPNTASGSAKDSCIASGWGTAQGPSSSASIVVRLALFSGKISLTLSMRMVANGVKKGARFV